MTTFFLIDLTRRDIAQMWQSEDDLADPLHIKRVAEISRQIGHRYVITRSQIFIDPPGNSSFL